MTINGLSGDSSGYSNPRIKLYLNGSIIQVAGAYSYYFYSGILPDTSYYFDGTITYDDPNDILDIPTDFFISGGYVTTPRARPSNFLWTQSNPTNGTILASEWRDFTSRINAFRYYKYMSSYSFTYVTGESQVGANDGTFISASIFNEAILALQPMISVISTVSPEQDILASYFNSLVNSLNSIV